MEIETSGKHLFGFIGVWATLGMIEVPKTVSFGTHSITNHSAEVPHISTSSKLFELTFKFSVQNPMWSSLKHT